MEKRQFRRPFLAVILSTYGIRNFPITVLAPLAAVERPSGASQ